MDLPKNYDPQAIEPRLYERWERNGYFHEEPDPARPPFIICMPPPNVTARAHLGHGSTYTPMDVLTRYHRMLGENADWLPGVDHAAIATETVLVKELAREGVGREDLGRERFVERAWDVVANLRRARSKRSSAGSDSGPIGSARASRWTKISPPLCAESSCSSTARASSTAARG